MRLWQASKLPPAWRPPACAGWEGLRFEQLVELAGRLPEDVRAEDLLARLGAVSHWTGMRYWSVSRRSCRALIEEAYALVGPEASARREDFAPAEMVAGKDLYFYQDDNGPGGGAVYRMRLREVGPERLVLETENVGAIKVFLVPLFGPGELRALYVLERAPGGGWSYYSLSGATSGSSPLAHGTSYVNRALALYAHVAGLDPCALARAQETAG